MKLFKNKKIVIMGLGLHGGGVGVAKFFHKEGAKLLITDLRVKKELKESLAKLKELPINFILGKHRNQDFIKADLIIRNPGVPRESSYLKIAQDNNIPIKTDIDIFFDLCPAQIIGITGTKGKSTTATLIYLLLKKKYNKVFLAGNIGISPLEIFSKIDKKSKIVLELSSFRLENLKKSPEIAVITNLFPDHLDRYKSFKHYINAKKSIFKYQRKNDILILNYNNLETRKIALRAKSKIYFFKGSNQAAAIKVAKLLKIPSRDIEKVISSFKGLANRQEFIDLKNGVKYINDTTATNPDSVILAIKRFSDSKIILIAGGEDKKLNYENLAREIKKNIKYLVLLPGTASNKIKKELGLYKIYSAKSMKGAVKRAYQLAEKGDIILLSPGAASFNLFKNEFDRGKKFVKEVKAL